MIDSVLRTGKNYYLQELLEECKYVNDDIEFFSHSDKENSDEETFGKENSDEKNSKYTNITHIFKLLLKRIKKHFLYL